MWLFVLSVLFSIDIGFTITNPTYWWAAIDIFIGTALVVEIIEHSIDYYFNMKRILR